MAVLSGPAAGRQMGRLSVARAAEDAAHRVLLENGYLPIGRNVRGSLGEIDVVAMDGDVLVFVEVKARTGHPEDALAGAAEAITPGKRRRLRRLAAQYIADRGWPQDRDCRFDAVAVAVSPAGNPVAVRLIRDAF